MVYYLIADLIIVFIGTKFCQNVCKIYMHLQYIQGK